MFNNNRKQLFSSVIALILLGAGSALAETPQVAIKEDQLPINVTNKNAEDTQKSNGNSAGLVSPSKPSQVANSNTKEEADVKKEASDKVATTKEETKKDDFDFDLKVKAFKNQKEEEPVAKKDTTINTELPTTVRYKMDSVESLGNSILSQMDGDLFSQMSEIEKSTTLLTLELRREKIRNEIEAQKAIRQKSIDDMERQREEARLLNLEKKKQIEASVLKEKQALLDKEQLFEVIKQRKLLNAYMNDMLLEHQKWLKEKENLYAQIAAIEQEKKDLIELFRKRIDSVLAVSLKNIQAAEAAKDNFERIVKNLKSRNEQLRKRVEADAKIIKNAKNNLAIKMQNLDNLKYNVANDTANGKPASTVNSSEETVVVETEEEDIKPKINISSKYAILGITGSASKMFAEIIDLNGQSQIIKVDTILPTGHTVKEIGSDYIKFSSEDGDDYLYVGKSIDGIVPTVGLVDDKDKDADK